VRTALIVPLAEAAPVVDRWRERSTGMPPHVTLLFPFVAPVTDALVADLQALFAPVAPFAELTDELVRRHPDHPPYGGAFPAIPHLTVVQGDDGLLDRAEEDVRPALPIVAEAREALLLEEGSPWRVRARFPFSA
jgi:hypothetical protein